METSARAMYQEHILEHYKHPSNFGKLEKATCTHREFNPLCGDDITMQIIIEQDRIQHIKFQGRGCALSMAAASMLTETVQGKTVAEVKKLTKEDVLSLLQIPIGPVRLKCALLPLETLQKAAGV